MYNSAGITQDKNPKAWGNFWRSSAEVLLYQILAPTHQERDFSNMFHLDENGDGSLAMTRERDIVSRFKDASEYPGEHDSVSELVL